MANRELPHPARMYSAAELANEMGVSRRTLTNWIKAGKFPEPDYRPTQRTRRWTAEAVAAHVRGGGRS